MMVRQLPAVVTVFAGTLILISVARGERVGYWFSGTLVMPAGIGPTYSWFGLQPTQNSYPVCGGFSYETTVTGAGTTASRTYPQTIAGGYWLQVDLGTSTMLLQSSDYGITVVNDQS